MAFSSTMRPGMRLLTTARLLGNRLDAAEGEDGFLEVGFLGLDGFDAEVLHAGFVEDDGVGGAFGIGRREGGVEDDKGKEPMVWRLIYSWL